MQHRRLKLLFVGPYPPPHGGISVHVSSACSLLRREGIQCEVLNVEPRAPHSAEYIKISGPVSFARELARHVWGGWKFHVHINGHNPKSWLIALAGGVAGRASGGAVLTIHSGIAPIYLHETNSRRRMARAVCRRFERIVCVNDEIAEAVEGLGIGRKQIDVLPAYLPLAVPSIVVPQEVDRWLQSRTPILSTALFFRPEYGFDVLVRSLITLVKRHPRLGCLVMGNGENRTDAEVLIDQVGLRESVCFLGDIEHDLCLKLMSRSQVFVRPTFRDGDSISVREAVSLGVPVVASDVGTRPPEVLLFRAGDSDELASRIAAALTMEPQRPSGTEGSVQRLLSLYSQDRAAG